MGETQLKTAVPMSQGYPGGWYKVSTHKVERGGLLEAELEGASSQGEWGEPVETVSEL